MLPAVPARPGRRPGPERGSGRTPPGPDSLPPRMTRAMCKLGGDLQVARRRRRLTIEDMCVRVGISKQTYQRIERGDPTVSMGAYVATLFSFGIGDAIEEAADMGRDDTGLLEREPLPKRVRRQKEQPFQNLEDRT